MKLRRRFILNTFFYLKKFINKVFLIHKWNCLKNLKLTRIRYSSNSSATKKNTVFLLKTKKILFLNHINYSALIEVINNTKFCIWSDKVPYDLHIPYYVECFSSKVNMSSEIILRFGRVFVIPSAVRNDYNIDYYPWTQLKKRSTYEYLPSRSHSCASRTGSITSVNIEFSLHSNRISVLPIWQKCTFRSNKQKSLESRTKQWKSSQTS